MHAALRSIGEVRSDVSAAAAGMLAAKAAHIVAIRRFMVPPDGGGSRPVIVCSPYNDTNVRAALTFTKLPR
jgi:hypothetical protein